MLVCKMGESGSLCIFMQELALVTVIKLDTMMQ